MALQAILVVRVDDLASYRDEWDVLAVSCDRPYCSPAWMLAWWRCVAERGARLRAVAVTDEAGALAGLAPFWLGARGTPLPRYRLLAAGTAAPVEPLARPGTETEVARLVAERLADARPRPSVVALDGVPRGSPWPPLLKEWWPGRLPPRLVWERSLPAPGVDLSGGSYAAWLAGRSSNFRQQMRRRRRRAEEQGARFVAPATVAEAEPRLEAFGRLHEARWNKRGGSAALNPRVERMLREVARDLIPVGRFRLWCIDDGDRTVSAHLFVAAGSRTSYWLGGFAEDWEAHSPALLTLLAAIEDGFSRGLRSIDLGPGGQAYKYRLAEREERLEWVSLLPRGGRYPLARVPFAIADLARALARRLPPSARATLRRLLGRG